MSANLFFLGTGHAMVTKCYNTCFLLEQDGNYFLTDAGGGNGILTRLEQAQIPLSSLHHMFVTHSHTDHILGVVWVIRKIASMMMAGKYQDSFMIYCHKELVSIIDTICRLTLAPKFLAMIDSRMKLVPLSHKDVIQAAGLSIQVFDIGSAKTKQYGFRARLSDGQILVCLGDEPFHEGSLSFVKGCDWLLSEAFCLYGERETFHPYEKHHSTALDAARTAQSLSVRNLVLYHTEDSDLEHRKERYTREAASVFSGRIFVPDDLEKIRLF